MSFSDTIDNLVSTLTDDTDLSTFCTTAWDKTLTVKKGYKERTEINLSELPVVRITSPGYEPDTASANQLGWRRVRLYFGFCQKDEALAVDQALQFEELIRAALVKDRRRGNTAQTTVPDNSINDEGASKPSFFTVMDVRIQTYKPLT